MSLYIFLLYYIYHLCFTCIDIYDLSAWGGCWFVVFIRRFIYKFLNVCPFDYTAVAGSGKVWPVNQVNHTSWVAVVTPTDRPKSVRNRYVIELFCGVVCVVTLPFWHCCWCRGFCHRTESDLFHFLSANNNNKSKHLVISIIILLQMEHLDGLSSFEKHYPYDYIEKRNTTKNNFFYSIKPIANVY